MQVRPTRAAAVALAFSIGCAPATPPAEVPAGPSPDTVTPAPILVSSILNDGDPAAAAATPDEPAIPAAIQAAVAAPDRTEEDRALDAGRRPAEMLAFFGITPGMRVAELAAGRGYTAELLARTVGPNGKVYGQNNRFILERFAEQPWTERLEKPVMKNVVRVDTELEAPLPKDIEPLDAVLLVLFYHDTVWFETDRKAMNQAVFEALKPGGVYGIVDHSAREGDGVSQAKTLHRIEESVVRAEVESLGFVLEAETDFLRNESDARDWNASPSQAGQRRGTSDRFVLKFVKPASEKQK